MKIALILHGLAESKTRYSSHGRRGWTEEVKAIFDYKKSLQNYQEYLFDGNNIDVFFHTYDTDLLSSEKLIDDMSPEEYKITDPIVDTENTDKDKRVNSRRNSLLQAISCFQETENEYDVVVITRFDLHFEREVSSLLENVNWEESGLYVSFYTEQEDLIDDNFFVVEPDRISNFVEIIEHFNQIDEEYGHLHRANKVWRSKFGEEVLPLIEGNYHININNPFYHIVRYVSSVEENNYEFVSSLYNNKTENCKYCNEDLY